MHSKYGVDETWIEIHKARLGLKVLEDEQIEQLLAEQFEESNWIWEDKYTYNADEDIYITQIPAAKKAIKLKGDDHRAIISAYSNWGGNPASVTSIATSFGLPVEWIKQYLVAHGVTHDSPPFSTEQLKDLEEDQLVQLVAARKNATIRIKAETSDWRNIKRDADKWRALQNDQLKPLENWNPVVRKINIKNKKIKQKERAVVLGLTDNHFGAYADKLTSGVEVTKETVWQDVMSAVARTIETWDFKPEIVYIPVGSDWWHIDGVSRGTQRGTPQSMHGSGASILKEGTELLISVIESVKPHCKNIVMVPMFGNHDRTSAHTGMLVLEAFYRNDKKVYVNPSRLMRCYMQYGEVMLAFTHGDTTKPAKSVHLASTEASHIWGSTTKRYMFGGHEHHLEAIDLGGMIYYKLSSLAKTDEWHHAQGWTGADRVLMSFVFTKSGLERINYVYPED